MQKNVNGRRIVSSVAGNDKHQHILGFLRNAHIMSKNVSMET